MIEFVLALLENLKVIAWVGDVGLGLWIGIFALTCAVRASEIYDFERDHKERRAQAWAPLKTHLRLLWLVLAFAVIGSTPSVNDVWRVRIGLIKFNLASPENVKGAAETIERIGHKLECKYIGCDEKKEENK